MRGTLVVVCLGALTLPGFVGLAAADPTDPPNMMPFECGGEYQTGACRTECNGDFPCCHYYYVLGKESFHWCEA